MVWERFKGAFNDTPWTMTVAVGSLLVWVLAFFSFTGPMQILGGELDVAHAWRWLTYPLANPVPPGGFLWLVLGLWVFTLFAGPLERGWGSLRFGRIFLIITLVSALADWLAMAVYTRSLPPAGVMASGLQVPASAVFMIWAAYNREATILFMFVVPMQAGLLAALSVALTFFSRGQVLGPPAAMVMACAWLWAVRARRTSAAAGRPQKGLSQWWAERQKARRKGKFQLLEGGSPLASPPRVANLQSLPRPPVKADEGAEKELNRILDKIRFEGMSSLTEAERATLDSQSRRLRGDA
jgi:membrane associated rhomboid family serine protease